MLHLLFGSLSWQDKIIGKYSLHIYGLELIFGLRTNGFCHITQVFYA
jgi:hypothetical protein